MKVKTSELEGAALDWAVAQIDPMCKGLEWKEKAEERLFVGFAMMAGVMQPCVYLSNGCCLSEKLGMRRNDVQAYSPSTNWGQGGPLIDSEGISLIHCYKVTDVSESRRPVEWRARKRHSLGEKIAWGYGCPTPLIAACRAIVAAKLGDTVDIPEELL